MKKLILVVLLTLIFKSGFCQGKLNLLLKNQNQWVADTISSTFEVKKIERIKNAYLIEIIDVRTEQQYRIVSLRKKNMNGVRLKVNNTYELKIWPLSPVLFLNAKGITKTIYINGYRIKVKGNDNFPREYTSSDILGLFYITK